MSAEFIDQRGDYHTLKAFQKAECIYDITFYFAHEFLTIGDRTVDQMIQAARSGKQNLAEGYVDGITSSEMMIRLTNVNRASLHELLLDYEDYLRTRGLEKWAFNDPRCCQTRAFCRTHLDSAVYREKIRSRSAETIANIAITLIHQEDVLLKGLIEWMQQQFLQNGGFKEQMYRARVKRRGYGAPDGENGYHGSNGANGYHGSNGANGYHGSNGANGYHGFNGFNGSNGGQRNPSNPQTPLNPQTPSTPQTPSNPQTPLNPQTPSDPSSPQPPSAP